MSAGDRTIRLAMLGMVEENGHPYSWSAIINGSFDADLITQSAYPMIADYLCAEPAENLGILGAEVTHVWCDRPADAERVARACHVPNVVREARDVIGQVDAVLIATDIGHEHLERSRQFIEAGLPVFVDKPLTDRADHLKQFARWYREGRQIVSNSAMRYAREFRALQDRIGEVGEPRWITMSMAKSWERYGIHAMEGVYGLLPPGQWLSVANSGLGDGNLVQVRHASGVEVTLGVFADLYGAFGCLNLYGTRGCLSAKFADTFFAFKSQLQAFVEFVRTGRSCVPFEETIELMKIIIAGIRSRAEGGRRVDLSEIAIEE